MGKKIRKLAALGIFSTLMGSGALATGYLYRITCVPRKRDDSDANPMTLGGRRFVRKHPRREDHYISSIDSLRLHSVYIPAETPTHDYSIVVHGVWDNCESIGDIARHYLDKGMNVLLPDLRGHGKSEGTYIGYGYDDRLDILEWIYWIIKKDREARIILHGVSMGAATVLMTTGEHLPQNVKLAISDSSYTTAIEEFCNVYESQVGTPVIPKPLAMVLVRLAIWFRAGYDVKKAAPIEAVKRSSTPTLFLHGDSDHFVDTGMCARLYEAAACEKRHSLILGADHCEGGYVDPASYWGKADEFIREHM